jgi:hypothetical protein
LFSCEESLVFKRQGRGNDQDNLTEIPVQQFYFASFSACSGSFFLSSQSQVKSEIDPPALNVPAAAHVCASSRNVVFSEMYKATLWFSNLENPEGFNPTVVAVTEECPFC